MKVELIFTKYGALIFAGHTIYQHSLNIPGEHCKPSLNNSIKIDFFVYLCTATSMVKWYMNQRIAVLRQHTHKILQDLLCYYSCVLGNSRYGLLLTATLETTVISLMKTQQKTIFCCPSGDTPQAFALAHPMVTNSNGSWFHSWGQTTMITK